MAFHHSKRAFNLFWHQFWRQNGSNRWNVRHRIGSITCSTAKTYAKLFLPSSHSVSDSDSDVKNHKMIHFLCQNYDLALVPTSKCGSLDSLMPECQFWHRFWRHLDGFYVITISSRRKTVLAPFLTSPGCVRAKTGPQTAYFLKWHRFWRRLSRFRAASARLKADFTFWHRFRRHFNRSENEKTVDLSTRKGLISVAGHILAPVLTSFLQF